MAMFTYDWEAWRAPDGQYVVRIAVVRADNRAYGGGVYGRPDCCNCRSRIRKTGRVVVEHYRAVTNEARAEGPSFDFRIVLPTGEVRWISHTCTPVYGDEGQWLGRRESNRDSTERKRREQEVQERSAELAVAVAELQRAAKIKDEFLAAVSHELRTPLMGIMSMSEVLELQVAGQLSERQPRYVHAIHENGERLLALINSLLRYTDLVAGNVQMTWELLALNRRVRECSDSRCGRGRNRRGRRVQVRVEPADLTMVSNAQGIMQVLEQLLDNAVKFTPAGGRIGVEATRSADGEVGATGGVGYGDRYCGGAIRDEFSSLLRRSTAAWRDGMRGWDWGWRLCSGWWRCWAGRLWWRAWWGRGAGFVVMLEQRIQGRRIVFVEGKG